MAELGVAHALKIGSVHACKQSLRKPRPDYALAVGDGVSRPGTQNRKAANVIGTAEYVEKSYVRVIFDKLEFCNRVELALGYEARRHEGAAG